MVKPRTRAILAFLGGVALIGILVRLVGVGEMIDALHRASPVDLAFAAVTYALFFGARGLRWRLLLDKNAGVRASTTTSLTAVGWLANSILPLKGGDVLRAALLARRARMPLVKAGASVALERVLDLLGLALVAAVGFSLVPRAATLPDWLVPAMEAAAVLPLIAIGLLVILVRWRVQAIALTGRLLRPARGLGARLTHLFETTVLGMAALAQHPRRLAMLVPLSLVIAILQAFVFVFLLRAFIPGAGIALGFAGATLFLLSFVVSITPGNVGTYEAAFVAVFVGLGLKADAVVPAAILTHVSTTLIVAVLGGVGLLALGAEPAGIPSLRTQPVPEGPS